MPSPSQPNTGVLAAVTSRPGRPLYESVKDALVAAIERGHFTPNHRLPSTKELSEQMSVSLVTAHRALQELEAAGIVERSQGRGTFVVEPGQRSAHKLRFALVLHAEASLADFYHSRILEGMRQACHEQSADLTIYSYGSPLPRELHGYLLVNPLPDELDDIARRLQDRPGKLVVGAQSHLETVKSVDVDNRVLSAQVVEHLIDLGHKRIGYVGNEPKLSNSRDRWDGFLEALARCGCKPDPRHVLHVQDWRLTATEKMRLSRMLTSSDRPTAIYAGGYYYALDLYDAASTLGLSIPQELSVVGVDDPPSAAHLSPPLTTVQQPLVELGHAAIIAISELLRAGEGALEPQVLRPELVIRRSTAPARRP